MLHILQVMNPAPTTFDHTLGLLLRERRIAAGLTLAQVAERIGSVLSTVAAYEHGRPLPVSRFMALSRALGVDPAVLLGEALAPRPEQAAPAVSPRVMRHMAALPEQVRQTLAAHIVATAQALGV